MWYNIKIKEEWLMFKINPYRPGAGVRPQYLAGRDEDIENVTNMFTALTLNIPTQSVIFRWIKRGR